jgi:hypothetical protein
VALRNRECLAELEKKNASGAPHPPPRGPGQADRGRAAPRLPGPAQPPASPLNHPASTSPRVHPGPRSGRLLLIPSAPTVAFALGT